MYQCSPEKYRSNVTKMWEQRSKVAAIFTVIAFAMIVPAVSATPASSPMCDEYYFWDNALDKCEPCNAYCRDFRLRKMEIECRELCPDYVKQLTAAMEESENALDSSTPAGGLPDWAMTLVIIGVALVSVVGVVATGAALRRRRPTSRVDGCIWMCNVFRNPVQETNRPETVSNETGIDRLVIGGRTDSVVVQVQETVSTPLV